MTAPVAQRGCIRPLLITLVLAFLVAVIVVLGALVATDGVAHADVGESMNHPAAQHHASAAMYCHMTREHPRSESAQWCRDRGWVIERHLIVGPHRHSWTDLPPCRQEDSHHCYWKARYMGNGVGHSFVQLGHLGYFYVKSISVQDWQ